MSRFVIANMDHWDGADLGRFMEQDGRLHISKWAAPLDSDIAHEVAEEFAERVHADWDSPREFDLLVWLEGLPGNAYRVTVEVEWEPTFTGRAARQMDVPA